MAKNIKTLYFYLFLCFNFQHEKIFFLIFLFVCLTLVSCITLSEKEKKVKIVHDQDRHLVKECQFIDGFFNIHFNTIVIKRKTFEMGGDRAVVASFNKKSFLPFLSTNILSVGVYRCSED